jgi:hypothetical protein
MEDRLVYLRCRNCGRYLLESETIEGYCSRACAEVYRACTNCGAYFPEGRGHKEQYCRPDCAVQYRMSRFIDVPATGGLTKELA